MYPKIDRPCPYADRLEAVMDGDFCRACQCTVFDLDAMAPRERRSFLKRTEGQDSCVTYRIKPALAAMAIVAAMGVASPAMAQDVGEDEPEIVVTGGRGPRPQIIAVAEPVAVIRPQDVQPKRERKRRKPRRTAAAPAEPAEVVVLAGRMAPPRNQ